MPFSIGTLARSSGTWCQMDVQTLSQEIVQLRIYDLTGGSASQRFRLLPYYFGYLLLYESILRCRNVTA